jgi:uncharacterized membrane protein YidH (DUF202 family)
VDARARKLVGWVIVAAGIVVAAVAAFADQIGLGGEGPDEFGGKQIAALIVGLAIAVIGLGVALWSGRPGSNEPSARTPTKTTI